MARSMMPLATRGGKITRDGKPLFLSGINYWSAVALAADTSGGGWSVLTADLDALAACGINLIRVMGATEGPDTEPWRIVPSFQHEPGRYDQRWVTGLTRLVEELEKRAMYAVVVLNNFWQWSGGMSQYVNWSGHGPIPYPSPYEGGSSASFERYAAQFFIDDRAKGIFRDFLRFFIPTFRESPAVIWELANEPRGIQHAAALTTWIHETARLVKSIAPAQLVTTGSEGETTDPARAGLDVLRNHECPDIDLVTCHIWAQNWGWVRPESLAADLPSSLQQAERYLRHHAELAKVLGKPLLLEEFGFPRDEAAYDSESPTTLRDRYFARIYALVNDLLDSTTIAGIAPWSWAGSSIPARPGQLWRPGDPLTGDPPHEKQGWYGIYQADSTTSVVRDGSTTLRRRREG
jgi:mannan endo-1,4-beta-mannosidase